MPPIRQTNFSAGELAPEYWGRTDLDRYQAALRTMRNFFSSQHGAAVSRPGTEYLGATKYSGALDILRPVRLIPFNYSDTDALVLEVGSHYIRFWLDGELIQGEMDFIPIESTAVQAIDFPLPLDTIVTGATSGATALLVRDTRALNADGTLDDVDGNLVIFNIENGPFLDGEDVTFSGSPGYTGALSDDPDTMDSLLEIYTPYAAADVGGLQYAQSGDILTLAHPSYSPRELKRFANDSWTLSALSTVRADGFGATSSAGGAYLKAALPTATVAEPALPWKWALTVVYLDVHGVLTETGPFIITKSATAYHNTGAANLPATVAVYQDLPVTLILPMPASSPPPQTAPSGLSTSNPLIGTPVSVRIFRGYGRERLGLIGEVDWLQQSWIDKGDAPNYAIQPPRGENPFGASEYPSAVAYYQDRLCFAGTTIRPELFLASTTGDYHNFDEHFLLLADDALNFSLASRRRAFIHSLCPLERLLAFTSTSIWALSGQQGEVLKFDSVDARVVEEVGANTVRPIVIGGAALYVRAKGRGARAIIPASTSSGYGGVDISILASHLFKDTDIVEWTYAEDPWGLAWALSANGSLLSLTFSHEQQRWAWARHATKWGSQVLPGDEDYATLSALDAAVTAICSVPEGEEDGVYMVATRFGGTFVERFTSRVVHGGTQDRAPLDSSVRKAFSAAAVKLTYTAGAAFTLLDTITGGTSGKTGTLLSDASGVLTLSPATGTFRVGETLTGAMGGSGVVVSTALSFNGLDHLAGVMVYAMHVETGTVYGPFIVDSDGAILLDVDEDPAVGGAFTVDVGLAFTPDLETLDLATTAVRAKQKTVTEMAFEVTESQGLQSGPDFDTLTPAEVVPGDEQSDVELVRANIMGSYNGNGRAVLRQTEPRHVTVLGLTREVDFGG